MNDKLHTQQINHDEIDLKEVLKTIFRYKLSIIAITTIFMIGSAIFAYTQSNIYSSSATVELMDDNKKGGNPTDIMMEAFGGGSANVDNQIEVFKSRLLAEKAFSYLDLTTFYSTNKNFRNIDLYKNSPFIVQKIFVDDLVYGKKFNIEIIDEQTFNLKIDGPSIFSIRGLLKTIGVLPYEPRENIQYNSIHKFGEFISNEYFNIKLEKIRNLDTKEYSFSFINNLSLYEDFSQNIYVSQVSKNATILKLNYQDTSNIRAKEILNALIEAYTNIEIEQKTKEANLTLDFIDNQINSINERLKRSETKLSNFKEKNQLVGLNEQAIKTTEQLSDYEAKLEEVQTELNILENLQRFINSNQDINGLTIGAVNFADPALSNLVTNLQKEATKKATLLVDYTELHPDVQKASQNIATLKRTIKNALENNIRQLTQRRNSLNGIIGKFNKSIATLPQQEKELARLTRFYSIDEKIYSFLLEKRAETAILKSSTISNSRILDSAIEAKLPIKPKRSFIVLVGIILGIIIGLAYAFIREFMNNTVKNAEDVEKLSNLPIYGIIPHIKDEKSKKLVDEAYRAIRTNLQFLPKHEKSEVMSILSSVSGEGKTTTSTNLARIIAQNKKKVIILDLDLRKSSVHKQFDMPNNIGMSNYLTEQNSLEEVIHSTSIENVDIITTGPLPPNPSELVSSDNMKELIELLKEKYDYVILDTPPVGLVTDGLILMNYTDINFLMVRASYTRKEFIKNLDRLSKDYSQYSFGVIINGVEIGEKYGYGYGSNYGYGYGNDKYYR